MEHKVQFEEAGQPATEEQISRFESTLGIQLPVDYSAFLRQTNGGHPEPDAFPIQNNPFDTHALIAWFFALDDKGIYNDLLSNINAYSDLIPADLMPIAIDPGGSFICIATGGENRGAIYFWDEAERYPPGQIPDYHNIYFVAHSFNELLNSLSELPDN
jgi:hypothetical protein